MINLIEDNITEMQEPKDSDSLLNSWFLRIVDKLELESTASTNINETKQVTSSISQNHTVIFSKFQDKIMERQIIAKRQEYDQTICRLASELVQALKVNTIDTEEMSYAEKKVIEIVDAYSFRVLGDVIQKIYLQYNGSPNMLAGICKSLERFDYDEVMPWGPTMLMGLLNHKSDIVKEYAISLVENWATTDLLPALKNIECKADWMQEYINDVVRFLEGCNVLHKEII